MGAGWHRGGGAVADIGCGPGAMLPALAAAVGPHGLVTALDADPEAVAAASALVAAADLGNVAVREGGADETGLAAGSLEVVMVRHVLAHNGGAEDAIVAHLAALLRPGGCLYLVDADLTAIRVIPQAEHPDLVDLQDRYLAFRAANGDDNAAGLRLAERLVRAGLELVEFRGRYVIRELSSRLRSPAGRPGRRWSRPPWRPPRISGAGTRPSRQRRPVRRPSSFRCSPPSAAVRPFGVLPRVLRAGRGCGRDIEQAEHEVPPGKAEADHRDSSGCRSVARRSSNLTA